MFFMDGKEYKAEWIKDSFEVTADIINGDNSGRTQRTKSMFLDYVGTFYNFHGKLRRQKDCTPQEWDELFLALTNPINEHYVRVPFLQSEIESDVYISKLKTVLRDKTGGNNNWNKDFDVTLVTMDSQWLAGQELKGVI